MTRGAYSVTLKGMMCRIQIREVIVICGRYTIFTEEEIVEIRTIIDEVSRKFGDADVISTGEIFPSNTAPVLTTENNRLTPRPAVWGFPKWNGRGTIINARCETALERKMFAGPLLARRCVVPSTGFYEWSACSASLQQLSLFPSDDRPAAKEPKTKLLFRRPGESMLCMAGMMNTFKHTDGKVTDAFVILTTQANASMRPFHDRMPVILAADECEAWINSESFMREVLVRECAELEWTKAA